MSLGLLLAVIFVAAFLGAFVGAFIISYYSAGYQGKRMAKSYQERMQLYLDRKEEELNQRIQRKKF